MTSQCIFYVCIKLGWDFLHLICHSCRSISVPIYQILQPGHYYIGDCCSFSLSTLAVSYHFFYLRGECNYFCDMCVVVAGVWVFKAISNGFMLATTTLQHWCTLNFKPMYIATEVIELALSSNLRSILWGSHEDMNFSSKRQWEFEFLWPPTSIHGLPAPDPLEAKRAAEWLFDWQAYM